MRKYVLDANCYIDASHNQEELVALTRFTTSSAPRLYLSSVIAAELRAGVREVADRKKLEETLLDPFVRRGRVLTPSNRALDALGLTLSTLRENEGVQLPYVSRAFAFDILLAYSCRESGVTLVTRNARDMDRIRQVFTFEHIRPYPDQP